MTDKTKRSRAWTLLNLSADNVEDLLIDIVRRAMCFYKEFPRDGMILRESLDYWVGNFLLRGSLDEDYLEYLVDIVLGEEEDEGDEDGL